MLDLKPGDRRYGEQRWGEGARQEGGERGPPNLELHGLLHGAKVHRDVGGIGDQPPIRPKEGTGEVQAFLDVGGDGCAL